MIRLLRVKTDFCHECNKHGRGVEFRLFCDPDNESFLCWEHFRLNTDILMEAGILSRYPRRPAESESLEAFEEGVRRQLEARPRARDVVRGRGESEGISRSHSIGIGPGSSVTYSRSSSWTRSDSVSDTDSRGRSE